MEIQLNSAEVSNKENQDEFNKIIQFLISELVEEPFELNTIIKEADTFSISITGIPGTKIKSFQITFDVGLFKMIYDVLYVILSNNYFFKNIGHSSGEFKIPTIEVPNWTLLDLAMANNEPVYFDVERQELHKYLYTLCLHFIARHEIRHIANGHIGYLVSKMQEMFFENAKNGLSPLDNQTLEMDVDSNVFVGMVHGLLNIPVQKSHVPRTLQNEAGIFASLFFVLKILFYCLPSKKVSSLSEVEYSSHPNSTLRYFFSFTAGLSFIQEQHPALAELFGRTYQSSWTDFNELDRQGLLKIEKVMKDHDWTMSDEGFAYANKVWNNWNNWIPKLQPFTYLKLAPPEDNA